MQELFTIEGLSLSGIPWEAYPRPQLRRGDWLCLNGTWSLEYNDIRTEIRVPFCPESLLSGVEKSPLIGEQMTYRRSFSIPDSWTGRRILLHFGAVMRDTQILVNGQPVCRHENGYLPFSADITDTLQPGENKLCVRVRNDLDTRFPWGKQRVKRGGMWYTPCSGIWQSVWLEPVPEAYIHSLSITCSTDWVEIRTEGVSAGVVTLEGMDYPFSDGKAKISFSDPHLWTPDDPHLYSFILTSGDDRIES